MQNVYYKYLHFFFNSFLNLFSSVTSGPCLQLNCLPAVHYCLPKSWVPRQPSTKRSSYPMMRRCLLLCRWSVGPRRRSPFWPPVARAITWRSSASQVRAQILISAFFAEIFLTFLPVHIHGCVACSLVTQVTLQVTFQHILLNFPSNAHTDEHDNISPANETTNCKLNLLLGFRSIFFKWV